MRTHLAGFALTGLVLLIGMTGCGRAAGVAAPEVEPPTPSVVSDVTDRNLVPTGYEGRYRAVSLVLEADAGPQLCLGPVAQSYPPQCGGPTVTGWDRDTVPEQSYESASGVRWGSFVLVGTFDGESLTLTEPATVPGPGDGVQPGLTSDFSSPCPEPEGGWTPPEPSRATDEALERALATAAAAEGYGGAWVDQRGATNSGATSNDPTHLVLNVTTTGDTAALEERVREVWGGSLCVSEARATAGELDAAQEEVRSSEGLLSSSSDVVRGVVELEVVLATEQRQAELDEEHGDGVVVLRGALQPID